jgi:hypothetical protein
MGDDQDSDAEGTETFELEHWMAPPFAARCPSLRTFASAAAHFCGALAVSRATNSAILVNTPVSEWGNGFDPMNIRRWNPSAFVQGWPHILPVTKDD